MLNWKVRVKNKVFWTAIIPAVLVLLQVILALFDVEWDFSELSNKLLAVINAAFVVLTIIGVVADPTTEGVADSAQAMTYNEPKKGDE